MQLLYSNLWGLLSGRQKRRIASKPTAQNAADWIAAGGTDPELSNVQTSGNLSGQTFKHFDSRAKSKDPSYQRATVYLPKVLHKRLKAVAVDMELEMSDIAEQAITAWLDEHS